MLSAWSVRLDHGFGRLSIYIYSSWTYLAAFRLLSLSFFSSFIYILIFPLLAKRVLSGSVGSVGGCVFFDPLCFQLLYGRTYSAAISGFFFLLFFLFCLWEAPKEIPANYVLKKQKKRTIRQREFFE